MNRVFISVLIACCFANAGFAKVGRVALEHVVSNSVAIVVAEVESVGGLPFGKKYARAKVVETWKGNPPKEMRFLASPTWTCDISAAIKGETVVLFLYDDAGDFRIAHSGRGRMPIREVEGKKYATIWADITLPESTPMMEGPNPNSTFIHSIEVSTLKELVRKLQSQPKDK